MSHFSKDDCFAPPDEPCEVFCAHCKRVYDSALIRYVRVPGPLQGYWCCAVPGCDGKGYLFDLFPTDPAHEDNCGGSQSEEDADWDEFCHPIDEDGENAYDSNVGHWIAEEVAAGAGSFEPATDWTPEGDIDDGDESSDDEGCPQMDRGSNTGRSFTITDYQAALDGGLYDAADARMRDDEARANAEREQNPAGSPINDDDIPF